MMSIVQGSGGNFFISLCFLVLFADFLSDCSLSHVVFLRVHGMLLSFSSQLPRHSYKLTAGHTGICRGVYKFVIFSPFWHMKNSSSLSLQMVPHTLMDLPNSNK